MFVSPTTGYEWRFRLFGVPVEVQPFFWLAGLILVGDIGYKLSSPPSNAFATMLVVVFMFFLSILIHELGHVLAFRFYGIHSRVLLHGFGGLAIPTGQRNNRYSQSRWGQVVVAAAGPAAQAVFVGVLLVISVLLFDGFMMTSEFPFVLLYQFDGNFFGIDVFAVLFTTIFSNLFWIVLNLLPILPMDGGHICEGTCKDIWGPYKGRTITLWASVITGVLVALWGIKTQNMFLSIFIGYMAFQSLQELQSGPARW